MQKNLIPARPVSKVRILPGEHQNLAVKHPSGSRLMAAFKASKQTGSMAVPTFSAMISSVFGIGTAPR
jgi:hypothetical protein